MRFSLSTVYRTLETLSEAGIIQKIEISGRQKRFEGKTGPHEHLVCTICDNIEDITIDLEKKQFIVSLYEIVIFLLMIFTFLRHFK